ncbi:hypothetical protein Bca4012_026517 [Brassica carinata]
MRKPVWRHGAKEKAVWRHGVREDHVWRYGGKRRVCVATWCVVRQDGELGGAEQEEFERLIGKIFEKASEARSKSEIKNCARPLVSFGPILYQELLGRETDRSFHNLVVILVRARVTNRRLRCSLDARVSITGYVTGSKNKWKPFGLDLTKQENVKRVNANLRMDFHNNGSNEWLGFRLESGREFGSLYLGSVRVVITKQHYQTRLAAFDHTKFDKDFGFKVILLTGRREKHMVITIENLINAGFNNWDELILRKADDFPSEVPGKYFADYNDIVGGNLDNSCLVVNFGSLENKMIKGKDNLRPFIELPDQKFSSIKEWKGAYSISSRYNSTHILLNPTLDFIDQFKASDSTQWSVGTTTSVRARFFVLNERLTIRVGTFVTLGTIERIDAERGWQYLSCKYHNKKVMPTTNVDDDTRPLFFCNTCDKEHIDVISRYYILSNEDPEFLLEAVSDLFCKRILFEISVESDNIKGKSSQYVFRLATDDREMIEEFAALSLKPCGSLVDLKILGRRVMVMSGIRRCLSLPHVLVLLHNTNRSKDDSMYSRYDESGGD